MEVKSWTDPKSLTDQNLIQYFDQTIKPSTIWNPTKYLNIWVTEWSTGLGGYATFPVGTGLTGMSDNLETATTSGVVIKTSVWGNIGTAANPLYNKGRVASHEVGHWLGLRHIWGDANCGDDFVGDTPLHNSANYGCPATGVKSTCTGTPVMMTMNYMDYTVDACKVMFTNDQVTRMQTAMLNGTYRKNLNSSLACSAPFCGTTNLTTTIGSLSDGSGTTNYNNNTNCKWVIAPAGATQIRLNFTSFATEANYDTVIVYDGPDESSPILMSLWGTILPPSITTTPGNGAMCVKFKTDATTTSAGWNANYTSIGIPPTCNGGNLLTSPTGTFTDGSGLVNYGNNQLCYWQISPPCATSVTLSLVQLNTEVKYDVLIVYNGTTSNDPILGVYSGSTIPTSITANSGQMLVIFVSDYSTTSQGFSASYTSTGAAFCAGTTTLNTLDYGVISDGSGTNKYCNNQNCSWLIQPPQANSITLNFSTFNVEAASSDGKSIYDAVEIYDGATTSATLLGRFTGNNIPPAITSSGGSILVKFYSDFSINDSGWTANYTSTLPSYCNSTNTLTAATGSFTDGSGAANLYANNSNCSWLIQPPNADSITLSFSEYNTELGYDGVVVYNGADTTSPVLGKFSGTTIPASVTATGGSMLVLFLSDETLRANGFTANYTSSSNIYTFTGNGNWNVASNWSNNRIPPNPFKAGSIFIDHNVGGNCVLNVGQTISTGTNFTVKTGKNLLIEGELKVQ